jgi:DNA-binding response OmpR family regulator
LNWEKVMDKLLVVEDDTHHAALLKQELEEVGYKIILASDGNEALQRIKEHTIDLVVLDIRMPGMDGVELLGRILALDRTLPVIIHSAYSNYKDNFLTWAADHYVVKSSDLSALKSKIQETLRQRKQAAL